MPFDIMPADCRSLSEPVFEAELAAAKAFVKDGKLDSPRREKLGGSLFIVIRCPCCASNGPQDAERAEKIGILQDLCGDDPDGMASDMEDLL
jgi:hypothetical protein